MMLTTRDRVLRGLGLALVLALFGCDGGGECPDVRGDWRVERHCDSSQVGATYLMDQPGDACSFPIVASGFVGTTAKLAAGGGITVTGSFGSCAGSVIGDRVVMSCNDDNCDVELRRVATPSGGE